MASIVTPKSATSLATISAFHFGSKPRKPAAPANGGRAEVWWMDLFPAEPMILELHCSAAILPLAPATRTPPLFPLQPLMTVPGINAWQRVCNPLERWQFMRMGIGRLVASAAQIRWRLRPFFDLDPAKLA